MTRRMNNKTRFMFTNEEILKKENEKLKKENEVLKNKINYITQYIHHNMNNIVDYMKIHGVNESSILNETSSLDEFNVLDENNFIVPTYYSDTDDESLYMEQHLLDRHMAMDENTFVRFSTVPYKCDFDTDDESLYMEQHLLEDEECRRIAMDENTFVRFSTVPYKGDFDTEYDDGIYDGEFHIKEAERPCYNTSICMNDELQEKFWKTFEDDESYYISRSICYDEDEYETDIMSDITDDEIQHFWKK